MPFAESWKSKRWAGRSSEFCSGYVNFEKLGGINCKWSSFLVLQNGWVENNQYPSDWRIFSEELVFHEYHIQYQQMEGTNLNPYVRVCVCVRVYTVLNSSYPFSWSLGSKVAAQCMCTCTTIWGFCVSENQNLPISTYEKELTSVGGQILKTSKILESKQARISED